MDHRRGRRAAAEVTGGGKKGGANVEKLRHFDGLRELWRERERERQKGEEEGEGRVGCRLMEEWLSFSGCTSSVSNGGGGLNHFTGEWFGIGISFFVHSTYYFFSLISFPPPSSCGLFFKIIEQFPKKILEGQYFLFLFIRIMAINKPNHKINICS